jgi:hypothetical protein
MPSPTTSWNLCRVFGKWLGQDGTLLAGSYKVSMPVRVTSPTDDVIIPSGTFAIGNLQTSNVALPSLDINVPANNDADITPNSTWQVIVEITFTGGQTNEKYVFDTPVGGSVDLALLPYPNLTAPPVVYAPFGIAASIGTIPVGAPVGSWWAIPV